MWLILRIPRYDVLTLIINNENISIKLKCYIYIIIGIILYLLVITFPLIVLVLFDKCYINDVNLYLVPIPTYLTLLKNISTGIGDVDKIKFLPSLLALRSAPMDVWMHKQ